MLIVNADDLGRECEATDRALSCFSQRRITSASGMVFMADSARAAELARAARIEVGLHINLSEPFTATHVPAAVREAQDRVARFLRTSKYALLMYSPSLHDAFRRVCEAQYAEFIRLYEREPFHFDGHQHMHLASNVLLQGLLPPGTKVRRNFSFRTGEKSLVNRCYRAAVDHWLARHHRLTDYFFSLAHHLCAERLHSIVSLASEADVELMTHPRLQAEFEFLMGDEYAHAVARVRLGGYGELN